MTKNCEGINKKGTKPAILAKIDDSNHERKAKWDQLRKVQEAMSSAVKQAVHRSNSGTRPANRVYTTRVAQCISSSRTSAST